MSAEAQIGRDETHLWLEDKPDVVLDHPPLEIALEDELDPVLPRELPRAVPVAVVEEVVAEPAVLRAGTASDSGPRSSSRSARVVWQAVLGHEAVVERAGKAVGDRGRGLVREGGSGRWGRARPPVGPRVLARKGRGHGESSRLVERAHWLGLAASADSGERRRDDDDEETRAR